MGLRHSSAAWGSLAISPEQRGGSCPGERVTGAVVLRLERALEHAELEIALVGTERLGAIFIDSEGHEKRTNEKRTLIDSPVVLYHGALAAGDLALPFSVPVPTDLPPTTATDFFAEDDDREQSSMVRVNIFYSLRATLTARDKHVEPLVETIKWRVEAWPSAVPVGEPREAMTSRVLNFGYFTKSGICALRMAIPSDVICIGTRVAAHVWLTLTPPKSLTEVRLSLRRRIVARNAQLKPHERLGVDLCAMRATRAQLGNATEFVLHLNIDKTSAPPRDRATQPLRLLPSESFRDFGVAYELVVECEAQRVVTSVRIPVTLVCEAAAATVA